MPKFTAPEGTQGIHIGGAYFPVDKDGILTLPEHGEYTRMLPAGYEIYVAPKTDAAYDVDKLVLPVADVKKPSK